MPTYDTNIWPPEIPVSGDFRLRNCTILPCFLNVGTPGTRYDLVIARGRIAAIAPAVQTDEPGIDLRGAMVWPCLTDLHAHLDKGYIWPRALAMDGTFRANLAAATRDQEEYWSADDLRMRISFGLRCAHAHGTSAIRTHIDSPPGQADTSWNVFREIRQDWAERIALQAVALVAIDELRDSAFANRLAAMVVSAGGILGAFIYPIADLDAMLDRLFDLAERHGLDLDLHVDETGDSDARGLHAIAATALRRHFSGKIVAGHCCSLALQTNAQIAETMDLVCAAGIAIVCLPSTNLHMQDRQEGRTPRWRGITLLHELASRGVPVALANDNVGDPFFPYGDHDLLDTFRIATLAGQLDYPADHWPAAVTTIPSRIMGLNESPFAIDAPADLILLPARSHSEMMSRSQHDRIVLRRGRAISRTLPDFRELDTLIIPARTA